ncbi:MAG TPA: hypothetical protein P5526_08675 [Anaerolineae bacterium]|nr:hypothetical protein [Anaerolineae bacterium]MCB0180972.1 hypothetical protein [Anaerolineae bacterium]MCB0224197.1 hypothetical protein [Anaerolineae bacterium]MCB9106444.1 hypothetical protein [Anaerolineales bacterium]HRV92221.1 hypothetical protein [Anaerolineae bacterium]
MVKWVVDWPQAKAFHDSIRSNAIDVIWAVKMPKNYPECRVTRLGIANIVITDNQSLVNELREDGGEVQIMP